MPTLRDSRGWTPSEEVVRLAARGDRAAMQQVLEGNYEYVRRMIYRLVGSDTEYEDLVQTVLERIVTSLATARLESALTTWIGGICVHVARDHLRRRKVRSIVVLAEDPTNQQVSGTGDGLSAMDARERLMRCETALRSLSVEQRMAFVLKYVEDLSVEEVARVMGSAKSTTRLRLYHGRKKFFAALAKIEGREVRDTFESFGEVKG